MGTRKCEQCNCQIDKIEKVSITIPEEECEYCHSDIYSEYTFCGKECAKRWLEKLK